MHANLYIPRFQFFAFQITVKCRLAITFIVTMVKIMQEQSFFRIVLILLLVNLQCAEATLYHLCMTLFQVFEAVPVG